MSTISGSMRQNTQDFYVAACSAKTCGGGKKSGRYDYEKVTINIMFSRSQ